MASTSHPSSYPHERDDDDNDDDGDDEDLFFHALDREPYRIDLGYFGYDEDDDHDDDDDNENSLTSQVVVIPPMSVDVSVPKTTSPPRTFLPLPNSGTAPHIWDFNYTADWRNEGFANSYWDIAFTFNCGTKQCRGFELGELRLIASSTFEPQCQCVQIVPSDAMRAAIALPQDALNDLTLEIYTEKHHLSKVVHFVALFACEDVSKCFPHIGGTITVHVNETTGVVSHKVRVSAIVIDPADTGGVGGINGIRRVASWMWYGGLADRLKVGLDWLFGKLFMETNLLYTETSAPRDLMILKTKGD